MKPYDVIIIGAGAAGLMAAASAAERGLRVLLLEKNKKLGVKILMSGGTRCNITHDCDIPEFIKAFGRQGKFLHSPLAALPPAKVVEKIESQGVATKIESTGKIFPVSNKAIDVRDALVQLAVHAGAEILPQQPVIRISKVDSTEKPGSPADDFHFKIKTTDSEFEGRSLIVTTGGKSYPGCGTTGDGYAWATSFGHSIVDSVPALVPILCNEPWANNLKGITIESTEVKVWQPSQIPDNPLEPLSKSQKKKLKSQAIANRKGSFLFTHWGFSGPSVLDVSKAVARHPNKKTLELVCDFLPASSSEELEQRFQSKKTEQGKQIIGNAMLEFVPKRLAEELINQAGLDWNLKNAELSKQNLSRLVQRIKQCHFSINGTLGFEKAEVTAGGVSLKEVDSKTMQSKIAEGLFFAGEILDLDGPIGGFNFQSAFSTGWLAGQSVLR